MKSKLSFVVVLLLTVFAFQNCGKGGFDAVEGINGTVSLSSTNPKNQNCTFDGETVLNGGHVTAYLSSTSTNQCVSQTRTCNKGVLSGTYQFSECIVGQAASCLFNGITVPSGTSFPAYQAPSVAYGQSCVGETRVCTSGVLSGSFTATNCTVAKPSLQGTWVQGCRAASSGSIMQTQTFSGGNFTTTIKIYPLDTSCTNQYATVTLTGNAAVGDQIAGTNLNKLDLSNIQVQLTPTNSATALALNFIEFCQLPGWQGGVAQTITGRTCTYGSYSMTVPSANLFTSFRIQNGTALWLGVPDNVTTSGTTDAMRAMTPDTVALTKQ